MSDKVVAFTVDVDRDVAWHEKGKHAAVSKGKSEPSFEATREGLVELAGALDDAGGVKATFFVEARTAQAIAAGGETDLRKLLSRHEIACHGFDHEDFTGEFTGARMSRDEKKRVLESAREELKKIFGLHEIKGFRAPYLHCDDELLDVLGETGFEYDSSRFAAGTRPRVIRGVMEVPLFESLDARGKKMNSYLWPLMEGKRSLKEVVDFVKHGFVENDLIVLATHSWHSHHAVDEKRSKAEACKKIGEVKQLLKELSEFEFATIRESIDREDAEVKDWLK